MRPVRKLRPGYVGPRGPGWDFSLERTEKLEGLEEMDGVTDSFDSKAKQLFCWSRQSCSTLKSSSCEVAPAWWGPVERIWERKLGPGNWGSQEDGAPSPQTQAIHVAMTTKGASWQSDLCFVKCIVRPPGDSPWLLLLLPEARLIRPLSRDRGAGNSKGTKQ